MASRGIPCNYEEPVPGTHGERLLREASRCIQGGTGHLSGAGTEREFLRPIKLYLKFTLFLK